MYWMWVEPGNPSGRGRLSTGPLLVLTSPDQLLLKPIMLSLLFNKTSHLHEEINCTEYSLYSKGSLVEYLTLIL
jgi:hypothetical protein